MLYLILINIILLHGYNHAQKLIGTHILFRHGERSPITQYGTSPNDLDYWSNGLGQLTIRGKLQHIYLGQYLRERYSNLLNSTYVASEITIRSTDYDRTLMSAYSNLVGLYSSANNFTLPEKYFLSNDWPEALPWEPIPVHTVPKSIDHLMGISNCNRYEQLVDELRDSSTIQNLNNEYQDFFKYLEEHTNQTIDDIFIAWDIADTVLIEDIYNVTPAWVTPSALQKLRQIEDLSIYNLFHPPEIHRLRGGPLIRDILQNIKDFTSNNGNGRKVKIYSGHDTTIAAVVAFLGIDHVHQPPFASALFFDLYQQDDKSYSIQVEFLNVTNSRDPSIFSLPGCPDVMCPLDTFIQLYETKFPDNMDEECQAKRFKRTHPPIHHVSFASE